MFCHAQMSRIVTFFFFVRNRPLALEKWNDPSSQLWSKTATNDRVTCIPFPPAVSELRQPRHTSERNVSEWLGAILLPQKAAEDVVRAVAMLLILQWNNACYCAVHGSVLLHTFEATRNKRVSSRNLSQRMRYGLVVCYRVALTKTRTHVFVLVRCSC